jgi:hypothetical protein
MTTLTSDCARDLLLTNISTVVIHGLPSAILQFTYSSRQKKDGRKETALYQEPPAVC